jgi:hypothetical protein
MSFDNLSLVNPDYIYKVNPGAVFSVVELKNEGKGRCHFTSKKDVLFIKGHNSNPIVWALRNKKCAEAAFVVKNDDSDFDLHIIEMKSGLSSGTFAHAIDQFKGMYLSSIAAISILRLPHPKRVFAYIAFKKDNILEKTSPSPVLLKTTVGGCPPAGLTEWNREEVNLDYGVKAKLVKGQRISDDCDFGEV